MRENGALKPHGASATFVGNSNGAKYRDMDLTLNVNNRDNNYNNKNHRIYSYIHNQMNSLKNNRINVVKCNNNYTSYNNNRSHSYCSCAIFFMMRVQQSLSFYLWFIICSLYVLSLLPNKVYCDDNDNGFFVNSFSMEPEITTPEFDYASRGRKKFGDKCDTTLECGFPGSECHPKKKSCQCTDDLPVTNHLDKCGKGASINESCFFNEQCESVHFQTECRDNRCVCRFEMTPVLTKEGVFECKGKQVKREPERYIDPAMIGVLVGMALMFVIICVVLRLFSNARWRENRTIFNTPNPRLMNVSLLRDSKLLHGQERRGSRMSVRVPSRQPSLASLRPHSPNPSLGSKTASRESSNASMASVRSNRSNTGVTTNLSNTGRNSIKPDQINPSQQPLITNIISNPATDNVTVEIINTTNK